nr:Ig-like domain-containing protein [Neobacillus sp. Marseille-Q6967]
MAFAETTIVDVSLLSQQNLDVSYEPTTGNLIVDITGIPLAHVGVISNQAFIFQLPEELKFILEYPGFQDAAQIDLTAAALILGVKDTVPGNSLVLNHEEGTITGLRTSLLDLSLLSKVSVKLTINLTELGVNYLPASKNGLLGFYGLATNGETLIDLEILAKEGAFKEINTRLLPPTVNPVTDVDELVTGTGKPGAMINVLTPNDGNYQGAVDAEGKYSIEIPVQEAGNELLVSQTDTETGLESEKTSTIVIGTILELNVPSEILFETTTISLDEVTIRRAVTDWTIKVRDTRGQGSQWKLKARAADPLMSLDGHRLNPEALVFVQGKTTYFLNEETLIKEGTTGTETETTIMWPEDEGILIKVNPTEARPGVEYSTTIQWTLENAP